MSVKKDIYIAITEYLKTNLNGAGDVPALAWIDKDMGQLNNLEQFHPLPMPAILMSFGQTRWTTLNPTTQQGETTMRFKVICENYADSFDGSPDQALAISFFDFNEEVYKTLQGLQGATFTPMIRVGDEEDEEHGNFIVTILDFATTITDITAKPSAKFVDAEANSDVQYKKTLGAPADKMVSDFVLPDAPS